MADPLTEAEIEKLRKRVDAMSSRERLHLWPFSEREVNRLLASLAEARARVAELEAELAEAKAHPLKLLPLRRATPPPDMDPEPFL